MSNLDEIARKMAQTIPPPAQVKARRAKSWAKLKVGQLLRLQAGQSIYTGPLGLVEPETDFEVVGVDSLGADLQHTQLPVVLNWVDRNWQKTFTRVKRSKKIREEKTSDQ